MKVRRLAPPISPQRVEPSPVKKASARPAGDAASSPQLPDIEGGGRFGAIPQRPVWSVLHPLVTPEQQARALKAVLDRVSEAASQGKVGVVQVDLDLTSLLPVQRTVAALRLVGEKLGIPELADPTSLPLLPGYTTGAFDAFLAATGLREKYPSVEWGQTHLSETAGNESSRTSLYWQFRNAYWYGTAEGASRQTGYVGLESDQPSPGLSDFVAAVRARGGEVVFNSGRGAEAEPGTRAALERAGIDHPVLLIGSQPGLDGGQVKALRQSQLDGLGPTVAVIDDRKRNRDELAQESPSALLLAVAAPGFTAEPPTAQSPLRISTFELSP